MIENKGMCPPMDDRSFYDLMTENGTRDIEMIMRFYPQLSIFIKEIQ